MSRFRPKRPADGWWPARDYPDAAVNDELLQGGNVVAGVMSWYEDGPVYGIASTPEGPTVRSGAIETLAAAKDWCERLAGVKPRLERDLRHLPK